MNSNAAKIPLPISFKLRNRSTGASLIPPLQTKPQSTTHKLHRRRPLHRAIRNQPITIKHLPSTQPPSNKTHPINPPIFPNTNKLRPIFTHINPINPTQMKPLFIHRIDKFQRPINQISCIKQQRTRKRGSSYKGFVGVMRSCQ